MGIVIELNYSQITILKYECVFAELAEMFFVMSQSVMNKATEL